jgi:hypothetical protein
VATNTLACVVLGVLALLVPRAGGGGLAIMLVGPLYGLPVAAVVGLAVGVVFKR